MHASIGHRLLASITLVAFVASGCAMKSSRYHASGARSPGAAPPVMAGPESMQVAGDAARKPAAEQETWKRSQLVPNTSRLMVGDREELALRGMQTHVTIDGFRARVVTDYLFANHLGRPLEGTFQLRLPEEASPYFFAFGATRFEARTEWSQPMVIATSDAGATALPSQIMAERQESWLAPKEARMVPREKAAHAYGDVVRQRVDPALVEWAGAGVFNARVFPIAPGVLHRIVVGYDVDLVRIGEALEYRLDLPEKVPATVDVSVAALANVAITAAPAGAARASAGRKQLHFADPQERTIKVRLDGVRAPTIAGADPAVGEFFAAQVAPQLPADAAVRTGDAAVFLVDTSLSSNPDRFNVWLKLLRAVLEQNRDSLRRFDVLFFGVDAHWYGNGYVENTPENVEALLAFANTLGLEGATDLGAALAEAARPAWLTATAAPARHDVFLLSDGAATWGEGNLHAIGRRIAGGIAGPLFAYQTGMAGTDVAALAHLTRETGGALFSVTGEAEVARAATAHRARPWRLVEAKLAGATDLLLAGRPATLFPGQTLLVAGRGAIAPGAELELIVERGGHRAVVKTPLAPPIASPLAARAYGQVATAQLEELETATEPEARAYAMQFRVTGRTCSLLMLESEADYRRYNIVPEDDGRVVRATAAGALVAKTLRETYEQLGDPKQAFLAMLAKLARTPGVAFQPSRAYRDMVQQLPAAAFGVASAPLATRFRTKAHLSPAARERLARHELDYDAVSAAAQARRAASPPDALKTLSSLVEQNPGDAVLARDVGYSAMDLGLRPQAYHLFRRVAELRPFEPQTYRAMAQVLAAMGNADLALAYYEIPLSGSWDSRFGDLRKIVELDYLRLLRRIASGGARTSVPAYVQERLQTLSRGLGLPNADVLVTITWNTDNTDVDLHVVEPTGEECSYKNRRTQIGGQLTQDVTRGYGPEMYVLPRAPRGRFNVRAHYYASDRNRASARTKVYVTLFEQWGTVNERVTEKVIALEDGKQWHDIATLVAR